MARPWGRAESRRLFSTLRSARHSKPHNFYGKYMQMKGDHASATLGWGVVEAAPAGGWELFQIFIPDSGGVFNSVCNHPGAAYIYSPK